MGFQLKDGEIFDLNFDTYEISRFSGKGLFRFCHSRRVTKATKGEEGISKACEFHPDLVLMDISLPDINGFDATRRIRTSLPETKVIVINIHSTMELVRYAARYGPIDVDLWKE